MKKKEEIDCQVDEQKTEPLAQNITEVIWLEVKDLIRKAKESYGNIRKFTKEEKQREKTSVPLPKEVTTLNLQAGECVQVKSAEEIKETLDGDGKLQGCAFTKEMWPYCGQEVVVFKRVDTFLNETNNKVQKISNTVLLENAYCSGQRSFGEVCDRACFLFWKEAWLKRLPDATA